MLEAETNVTSCSEDENVDEVSEKALGFLLIDMGYQLVIVNPISSTCMHVMEQFSRPERGTIDQAQLGIL
jgi:hypothetical protein